MKPILITLLAVFASSSSLQAWPDQNSIREARQDVDVWKGLLIETLQAQPDYRDEPKAYAEWILKVRHDEHELEKSFNYFVKHFPPPTFEYKE
jgi:hypothetical protein